jgi:polysaccharide chain length determinant protein (PEP-CTERM system associated)
MRKKPAAELSDYWNIFLRRKWWIIIPALVIAGGTIMVVSKLPKVYRSQTLILVDPQKVPADFVKPTVTTNVNNRLQIISQEILSRTHLQRIIDEFGLYRNEATLDRILALLLRTGKRTQEEIVDSMRKDISVETIADEDSREHTLGAFRITYQGPDPAMAQQVTRELAALFIEENLKVRDQQAQGTTHFIDDQLEKARGSLSEQERRLKDFKALHMGSLPEQEAANLQLLGQLQTALQVNGDALGRAQAQKIYMESLLSTITARQAEALQPLTQSELDLRREELKQAESRYTPLHPDVVQLREEVSKLEQSPPPSGQAKGTGTPVPTSKDLAPEQIRGQIGLLDDEIKRRTQQQADVEKRIRQMQTKVEALPAVEQQMLELDRDYQISKLNYASLLEKKNASMMAAEMEHLAEGEQFRVLDPADYPEKPFKPDVMQLSLLGVLGGILGGCALGLLVEFQDKSIRTAEDATFYLTMPALASFPLLNHRPIKNGKQLLLPAALGAATGAGAKRDPKVKTPPLLTLGPIRTNDYAPSTPVWRMQPVSKLVVAAHDQMDDADGAYAREQFRMIRTRLLELMRVRPIRSIMVTSTVQGEGKTWVATNLAFSMSCLPHLRVLLVDADLRSAGLGSLLKVNPKVGLSDYLVNGNNLNSVRCQLQPNLALVPTRQWEDDSAKLLGGQRMNEFLEESFRDHDLVVLDAPPVLALADAQVLTALVDAVILVVRAGHSPYDLARNAIDLLKPKIVGLVVNGVKGIPAAGYGYGVYSKARRSA